MDLRDWNIFELLKENSLKNLQDLLIYSSRNLTLEALYHVMEMCPNLSSVRYLSNWKAVTRMELLEFWNQMRENNVDIDFGENEWKEDMERRKERDEISKNK